jgi:hypothetical protein
MIHTLLRNNCTLFWQFNASPTGFGVRKRSGRPTAKSNVRISDSLLDRNMEENEYEE